MQNLYKPAGKCTYTNSTGTAIESGDVIDGVRAIGVAFGDIANGDAGEIALTGQYELAKETGVAFAQFDKLYWDAANTRLTKTASTHTTAGMCVVAAGADDATAIVEINSGR